MRLEDAVTSGKPFKRPDWAFYLSLNEKHKSIEGVEICRMLETQFLMVDTIAKDYILKEDEPRTIWVTELKSGLYSEPYLQGPIYGTKEGALKRECSATIIRAIKFVEVIE